MRARRAHPACDADRFFSHAGKARAQTSIPGWSVHCIGCIISLAPWANIRAHSRVWAKRQPGPNIRRMLHGDCFAYQGHLKQAALALVCIELRLGLVKDL
jgi:hypothetical protein